MIGRILGALVVMQALLGARVIARLLRTAGGTRIAVHAEPLAPREFVSVIVPVLNEVPRLAPCLDGLIAQGPEVAEILVVDGGSDDGTRNLVRAFAARDGRLRLLDARPIPLNSNGKAHGLQRGLVASLPTTAWVLTIDADVRPEPTLARSLIAHARAANVTALSAATAQTVSGAAEATIHPAMLTTLVYRFGIPGHATTRVAAVQANGQCFLVRREALVRSGGFAAVADSVCEDVTLARGLAKAGEPVGFYETDDLVAVAMYDGWRDAWRGWARSLPTRDRYWGVAGVIGLIEVVLVQALPLPLAMVLRGRTDRLGRAALALNVGLATARIGVLAGTARAYRHRPWTYWLSPLADLPVAIQLVISAARRRHVWRGRAIVRGHDRGDAG